jgi:hypothetical protein
MGKHDYVIKAEKLNVPLKKMWRVVRMMGFKNSETDKIIDLSVLIRLNNRYWR